MQILERLQEPDPGSHETSALRSSSKGELRTSLHFAVGSLEFFGPLQRWERRLCIITAKKGGGLPAVLGTETIRGFLLGPLSPSAGADSSSACTAALRELWL